MHSELFNPAFFSEQSFSYCVLSGVKDANFNGDILSGTFLKDLVERVGHPRGLLIEKLVNWPDDPESIRQFTLQYGPLEKDFVPDAEFSFDMQSFRVAQEHFRGMWRNLDQFSEWKMDDTTMRFHRGSVACRTRTLKTFLHFDLLTCPAERIKVCKREACEHPYFIADDLKRKFCSAACAEEGRRELKRDWWLKNGQRVDYLRRGPGHEKGKPGTQRIAAYGGCKSESD
jgi:hypothetical protein